MDLSKAKTVLIITFLLLNIFLLYQILEDEGGGNLSSFGRKEELSRLEVALQEANLALDTSLPRGGLQVAHLVVEPWRFEAEEIISDLWSVLYQSDNHLLIKETSNETANEEINIAIYNLGKYKLYVRKEGSISVVAENPQPTEINNIEEIQQSAQKLMAELPFLEGFIYDYAQDSQKGPILNYRQEYDEYPLYAGYLQLYMNGAELSRFYLYRLEPVGFAEQKREIIPPSTALLRFIEAYKGGSQQTSIIEFSLGFYSQEYDAERWEIPPVWRIRLNNGEVYYINAFTGNLER